MKPRDRELRSLNLVRPFVKTLWCAGLLTIGQCAKLEDLISKDIQKVFKK